MLLLLTLVSPLSLVAQSGRTGNVAPFVEQQFYDMQTWGDPLAARVVAVDGYSVADLTDYTTAIGAGFPERHYQGIARNSAADGTPYLHLTRSRNPNRLCFLTGLGFNPECFNFGPGEYVVMEMGSRGKDGERLRSNRLQKDEEFENTLPPALDRYVKALRFDGRNGMPRAFHPSGISLFDDVLLIGYDTSCGEAATGASLSYLTNYEIGRGFDPQGAKPVFLTGWYTQSEVCELTKTSFTDPSGLLLVDVKDPKNPVVVRNIRPFGGGGTPSVIRRANGRYLIGDLGGTGANVNFYETNTDDLRTTSALESLGSWEVYRHFGCAPTLIFPPSGIPVEVVPALGSGTCAEGDRKRLFIGGTGGPEYPWGDDAQGFNLVRDQLTGVLYAFLFDNTTDSLSDGDDIAVMLRVDEAAIERRDWHHVMTYAGSKQFEANDAGLGLFSGGIAPMGDFEAAASIYVSPSGQMILYAAMHDGSTLDGQKIVEMGEFRNRFVTAPTPVLRDTFGYQCGPDVPVTINLFPFPSISVTPCSAATGYPGPRCVAPGPILPQFFDQASVVEGERCRSCTETLDCQQSAYVSQCGTVFNHDYLPRAQQRFGPGPLYPVTTIGTGDDLELALPPYVLVEPWVMLHDKYDLRGLFTSDDPKMSLMMDWADRDKDDFLDLSKFDSPGIGTFDDDATEITYCVTPGVTLRLLADSGGGCAEGFLTVAGGDATAVRQSIPASSLSCVRMSGELGKDETIHWQVDGLPLDPAPASRTLTLGGAALGPGTHSVTARIWNRTIGATVVVVATNRAPAFAASDPAAVNEDSGSLIVPGWATFDPTADAGQPDEDQTAVAYQTTMVTNPQLFEFIPGVSADGTLRYTVAENAFGTSSFTLRVVDSGGTSYGGVNTSSPHTFTLTVRPVNDPPSFSAASPPAVLEDAGPQSLPFATFSPGPFNEGGQGVLRYVVSAISTPALFANGPSIDATGRLSYTPAPNAHGASTFTVQVQDDGGTGNGGIDTSDARIFTITILPVNDAPVAHASGSPASQTLQYSDGTMAVTFSAVDIDSPGLALTPDAALPAGLSLSNAVCTPVATPLIGSGSSCSWMLTGTIGAGAGTYDLVFTARDGSLASATSTQIVVTTEDAQTALVGSNPVTVAVAEAGGSSVAFDLAVSVREVYDTTAETEPHGSATAPGDASRAAITISLVPIGPGSDVTSTGNCQAVDNDLEGYDQVSTVNCRFESVPVNTYMVKVSVGGGFYHDAGTTEDQLVVTDPSLGRSSGGGWFYWPGTRDRTNFAYSIGANGAGGTPTGNLLLTRRRGTATEQYVVRASELVGLSRGTSGGGADRFGWAAFLGKADGNREFTVYVESPDNVRVADRFWIEVRDSDGKRLEQLSFPLGARANAVRLEAGAVVVP